jgi:bacillithiol biosynthesis cysteine-adding enzyme BshC
VLSGAIPFELYPGLSPLFLEFLRGCPEFYPDRPTPEASVARGKSLLGRPARIPAGAFRARVPEARSLAADLAAGRAVAVLAGHQVGLFTGPLFTVTKAFDAIRMARHLSESGVPAAPVFWALTDDHDLAEIARTARPEKEEPQILILEGADRSNRRPVGSIPLPERIREIVEAFRPDARAPESEEILEAFVRRYAPGIPYGEAFIESLFDLVGEEPLLVLDPAGQALRRAAADFFLEAARREREVRGALQDVTLRLERAGKEVPAAFRPEVFPFFRVEDGERRRIDDLERSVREVSSGATWASTDVLTRPVFKSFLLPAAVSVLGGAEIAYHAQALALYPVFGLDPPVLLPRSHLVPLGPPERRIAEVLGIEPSRLLQPLPPLETPEVCEARDLSGIAAEVEARMEALEPGLRSLDPSLAGALETARRKVSYQLEQLALRIRKAAERKDETASKRRRRLETMLLPAGIPAERLYPPLVPLLAYGHEALTAIREAAACSIEGAQIVALGADRPAEKETLHAG